MISALIITIIALFGFLGSVVSDSALPALQEAQDTVVAALTDVEDNSNSNDQDGDGNSDGDENENGDTNGDTSDNDNDVNGDENGENVNVAAKTTKVEAYNLAAGFVMPTLIPQVAVDNSSNLVSCDHPEADCEDTHPGNSDKSKNNNINSANGNSASHKKS